MHQKPFIITDNDSALEYIQTADPESYDGVLRELELKLVSKQDIMEIKTIKFLYLQKLIPEVFAKTGFPAIIETDINDVPTIDKYLTNEKSVSVDGRYRIVGAGCFLYSNNIETLVFEEGVEFIHDYAVFSKNGLKSVTFPYSMTYIGTVAFKDCANLENVTFSNPKTYILPDAFSGTKWINSFSDKFVVVNGHLLKYNGNDETVIIPEGVTDISHGVFDENTTVKKIVFPLTLQSIWPCAFRECQNLESVCFKGNAVEMISIAAFFGCDNLKKIILPSSVKELGADAFSRYTHIILGKDNDSQIIEYIKSNYTKYSIL